MKIYTKVVIGRDGLVIEEESYEYSGPVSECKGGGTATTTTTVPDWQRPYLENIYGLAQGQSTKPVEYYPGQPVAGFTAEQQGAQQATTNRAIMGSPLLGSAQQENLRTTSGEYLNPDTNPWLAKTYETAARDVATTFGNVTMPGIRKEAGAAGAWGGARQGVATGTALTGLSQNLGDLATKIYAPAYEAERSRQQAGVAAAPALAEADYADIGKLAAVGQEKQAMDQAQIDAAIKQWQFSQMEPWQRLGMYSNLVTGDAGGITTSSGGGGK